MFPFFPNLAPEQQNREHTRGESVSRLHLSQLARRKRRKHRNIQGLQYNQATVLYGVIAGAPGRLPFPGIANRLQVRLVRLATDDPSREGLRRRDKEDLHPGRMYPTGNSLIPRGHHVHLFGLLSSYYAVSLPRHYSMIF